MNENEDRLYPETGELVRVVLALPADLLKRIDAVAVHLNTQRDGMILQALERAFPAGGPVEEIER